MKIIFSVFALILVLPCTSQAGRNDVAVVNVSTIASFSDGRGTSTLSRGEVVRILKQGAGQVLVRRIENPPGWDVLSSERIEREKYPLNLNADRLVLLRQFRPVTSWDARRWPEYTSCEGSCDSGTTYSFKSDGSFEASSGGNSLDDPPAQAVRGRLYSYRDLYWAKTGAQPANAGIFYLKGDLFCDYNQCSSR